VRRAATFLLLVLTSAAAAAQQGSTVVDARKLELLRKMSPEDRQKLKERMAEIKRLGEAERVRLQENLKKIKTLPAEEVLKLREKVQRLTPEDQKEFADLAGGFFRWAHRMGYAEGFPRGQFFHWLKNEKPAEIAEIRAMEPGPGSPRVDRFLKLFHEFRGVMLVRTERHLKQHRCSDVEVLGPLREASAKDFWSRWQEINRACQARRASPGPVPPLPGERK
jgi:hypothetical protein